MQIPKVILVVFKDSEVFKNAFLEASLTHQNKMLIKRT